MDAYNEFDRLRKLPKFPGYCAGTLHTEREAFDLAVRSAAALQPVAREGEASRLAFTNDSKDSNETK